jgi:hypothetical protein
MNYVFVTLQREVQTSKPEPVLVFCAVSFIKKLLSSTAAEYAKCLSVDTGFAAVVY